MAVAIALLLPPPPLRRRAAAAEEQEGPHGPPELFGKVAVAVARPRWARDGQHYQLVRVRVVLRPPSRAFKKAVLVTQELVPAPPGRRHRAQNRQAAVSASLLVTAGEGNVARSVIAKMKKMRETKKFTNEGSSTRSDESGAARRGAGLAPSSSAEEERTVGGTRARDGWQCRRSLCLRVCGCGCLLDVGHDDFDNGDVAVESSEVEGGLAEVAVVDRLHVRASVEERLHDP